jgi:hydroxymethylglutaryl-CoA lyase
MNLPKQVEIVEVGPRDGLQNEKEFIPTEIKIQLIHALNETGIKRMEATSFVSPKHVPQMADADTVFRTIEKREALQYMVLIPNKKGYDLATEAGANSLSLVVGVSEAFNLKNVRMSVAESLNQLSVVVNEAKSSNKFVRFNIATAFWCPYEGKIRDCDTLKIVRELLNMNVDEIVLCDTIGRATSSHVYRLFSQVLDLGPSVKITAHFHDTFGYAHANSLAALQAGVSSFDTSIGGLGGCPFAPGAAGNAATEDFVYMLEDMGIYTGVDYRKLIECVKIIKKYVGRKLTGRLHNVIDVV